MQGKILVVDDSSFIRQMLSDLLQLEGFEVRTAFNAARAVAEAKLFLPDLVLMELSLPEMDGIKAAEWMKSTIPTHPHQVIFISSRSNPLLKESSFAAGVDDFIEKPFDNQELVARVKRRLANRDETKEAEDKARSEVLSQVMITFAHHINNALASMQMRASVTNSEDKEQVDKFFEVFDRQTEKIASVVKSLQEMAKKRKVDLQSYDKYGSQMIKLDENAEKP